MKWKDCLEADPNHWMVEFVLTENKSNARENFKEFDPEEPIPHIEIFKAFKHRSGWKLFFTLSDYNKINRFCEDNDITGPEVIIVKNSELPKNEVLGIYFDNNRSVLYCLPRTKVE